MDTITRMLSKTQATADATRARLALTNLDTVSAPALGDALEQIAEVERALDAMRQMRGGPMLNLANANATALLAWLGLDGDPCGSMPARELAAIVRRARWGRDREPFTRAATDERGERRREVTTGDDGLPHIVTRGGCRVIGGALPAERFDDYAARLLAICDVDLDAAVTWG